MCSAEYLEFVNVATGGHVSPTRRTVLANLANKRILNTEREREREREENESAYMEGESSGLEVSRRWILNECGRHHCLPQTFRLHHPSLCMSMAVTLNCFCFLDSLLLPLAILKGFFYFTLRLFECCGCILLVKF